MPTKWLERLGQAASLLEGALGIWLEEYELRGNYSAAAVPGLWLDQCEPLESRRRDPIKDWHQAVCAQSKYFCWCVHKNVET